MEKTELLNLISSLQIEAQPSEKPSDLATVEVAAEKLMTVMRQLWNEPRLTFNMLVLHTAVDWVEEGNFELVYQLFSTQYQSKLRVLVTVPRDNPVVPSVSSIWRIAEWQEREVYDLFGILYDNHPDLRRLFLEDEWQGFPLRKDYRDDFMLDFPKSNAGAED